MDAACLWLVDDPARFDVIVTDNLFGDIISDLGAALTGGLGLSPSGNLNPDRTGPSVFEPVHGSAPDIAGTGRANPAGAVLSAGLMLAHLGQPEAAADLDTAVSAVLAAGAPASTGDWEKALLASLDEASSMSAPKVEIYDTTLRDGSQQVGLDLTVADKLRVAGVLDGLGVDVIEGGWPGSNPKDAEFFERAKSLEFKNAQLAAFGATRLPRRGVDDDANLAALLAAETPIVTLVGKAWTLHVSEALRTTREENLAMVAESVAYIRAAGRRVVFDAEHFFDGYQADRGYALAVLAAAAEAGADTLALCDTNGGTLPDDVARIVAEVADRSKTKVGVHFHNDAACAVANSVVAVAAGGLHVQGAANGYGERCGNADLFSVIASLELKRGHELLPPGRLAALASTARTIADVANLPFEARQPYVGSSAFATKAGLHASAIARRPDAYSHIEPAAVGNQPQVLVSELAGRSNVQAKAAELGLDLSTDPGLAGRVLDQVKEAEYRGYAFEAADASFELLVRKSAGLLPTWFELEGYRVVIERAAAPMTGRRPTAARASSGCGWARTGWSPSARASGRCTRWTRPCAVRWSRCTRRCRASTWSTTRCASWTAGRRPVPSPG